MDSSELATEQAMPVPNNSPSVQGMVRADLETREQVGVERYGTALQPHNGRDALRDAYEEALDLACYLRQALAERDTRMAAAEPACGYPTSHPSHDFALPDEFSDGEFGPRLWCNGVPGDWQQSGGSDAT